MYFVQVMYPRINDRFDMDHYLNVHVPMGKGSLWRYEQAKPLKSYLLVETYGMDRQPESSPYHVVALQLYETKEEAEAFIRIFERPDVAKMLSDDWPKYLDTQPVCMLGKVYEPNMDETIEKSHDVLREAGAPE